MKIHFTKKEYRQLLDVFFLGDWMASAHIVDEESPYNALRNKIYAYAKDFGFDDLIEYDKDSDSFFETSLYESQGVMKIIDEYSRHINNTR